MFRINKVLAIFSIVMGAMMITWWGFLLATAQMPELETTPIQAALHLAAEFLTAGSLIVSGTGLLINAWWSKSASYVALGMLLYAVIQASGYSAQWGQTALVVMFAVTVVLIALFLVGRAKLEKVAA